MNKPLGKRPTSITGTRKYTSNRRGLVGVGIREKVKPLLSDEELAAQGDFIAECRKPHPRPDAKRLKRIAEDERRAKDYPLEWEKLPPDEFERRVRKWRKG